ncbi:Ubiquitin-like modifier-activating enzyme ATG7 [Cyberlindnera fabianii]|uniref:Ubiquitin-like modifier-activating enzyme ATG7 n=1 Tax=Cyberlindnera fabianii TaxID=36022 RepID=A0A1V2LBV3_CYBFA|nr:Ubiquitin-like modifier-activating enzyme ATG7 [Cyberlindnera fabianii]
MADTKLKFSSVQSFVDASFFQKLSTLKLDEFRLDETKKPISATVGIKSVSQREGTAVSLNDASFGPIDPSLYPPGSILSLPGYITNFNTIEEFKKLDKSTFIKDAGSQIYNDIITKKVLEEPSLLNKFEIISFADLKKFKFFYWVSFPSLSSQWTITSQSTITEFPEAMVDWINTASLSQKPYFVIDQDSRPQLLSTLSTSSTSVHVGFIDSCLIPDKPSKLLQNFLAALSIYGFTTVTLSIYRLSGQSYTLQLSDPSTDHTKITGWERTSQGKLGPKLADLGALIDPVKLSEQSVDLNLKLMKWRVAPELDLDVVKDTKVLLLGSGTLGSYVSRALLGWGVRHITFVDNGKVSFSNPVRQPLFNFEDVGELKAKTAAEALKKIFPLVNAEGHELEIPMAGHPITNEEKQRADYEKLEQLIEEHDAIFLLTDSRETRWLPTVIGNAKKKIVINCALGFDSYLVMRHGVEGNLGCYFCNDVVAPTDSLTDRTLDQMCTVTRPGVALMASSLGVELLVSLLQHPKKHYAAADESTILGKLPHQLRGFLDRHETMKLQAPAYDFCSACSKNIIKGYEEESWEFVTNALNDPTYLAEVSGLAEVQAKAEVAMAEFEDGFSDDDWN